MKRATLLRRRTPLRSRPKRRRDEPGRAEWKIPHAGYCSCGCNRFSLHLHRHHVLREQHVRAEGGDVWDLANSMLLHPHCHAQHHSAARRIPLPNVPEAALAFAVDLLGLDRAALYMAREYASEIEDGRWRP